MDCVAAKNTANIVKMHEKHAAIAEQMLRKATHRLLTLADEDVDANAVVRMVDIGVKVERLSGESPRRTAPLPMAAPWKWRAPSAQTFPTFLTRN